MKLEIWRNQKDVKGLLGGHKGVAFSLVARVQLEEEEKALIAKYKVGDETLATYKWPGRDDLDVRVTIQDLLGGKTVETQNIGELIDLEEKIKEGCKTLKGFLAVMRTFGGYEAIEI